jgi:NAD-dependent SIR2 family protein deacetylase
VVVNFPVGKKLKFIYRLRKLYFAKKAILGKTGAGISSAADIKDGSKLQNLWGNYLINA